MSEGNSEGANVSHCSLKERHEDINVNFGEQIEKSSACDAQNRSMHIDIRNRHSQLSQGKHNVTGHLSSLAHEQCS